MWIYHASENREYRELYAALGLDGFVPGVVVSVVGAGGKTTVCHRLGQELAGHCGAPESGQKVLVTTTTHMFCVPPNGVFLCEEDEIPGQVQLGETDPFGEPIPFAGAVIPKVEQHDLPWENHPYLLLGCDDRHPVKIGKMHGVPDPVRKALENECYGTVIEADGARGRSLKLPRENEPVIPTETDLVLVVAGLCALGRTVEETCFNENGICELLNTDPKHLICEEDIAVILKEGFGKRIRNLLPDVKICYILNQCDNARFLERGIRIASMLDGTVLLTAREMQTDR